MFRTYDAKFVVEYQPQCMMNTAVYFIVARKA